MDSLSFHSASDLAGGGGGGGGGGRFDEATESSGPFPKSLIDGIYSRTAGIGFLPGDVLPSSSSSTGSSLQPTSRLDPPRIELSEGALAGIIVATVVVTLVVVALVLWMHMRRRKSKSQELNVELSNHPPPQPVQTHFNLALEPDVKTAASRQNSVGSNGGPPSFRSINEELDEEFTDYGSVLGSFPPSPTLSFRSVVDGPGFSRSRSGTGTSFGTVASFASDWTRRSRASTTASFHTCVEEDFTNSPPS